MAKTRIFLTGGSGMVGQNIKENKLADLYEIIAPNKKELNIRDYVATRNYILKTKPDVVIHAAGRVGGIQANIASPVDFMIANVDLGRNLIMAARETGIAKLINIACSCIYPRNSINPLKENMLLEGELEPSNEGFALSKLFAIRLCEYINRENNKMGREIRYKTLISCNIYGRHDKFDPQSSHLIPAIIHKLHSAKTIPPPHDVVIWGDGSARREFMYAGDLAVAIFQAVEQYDQIPNLMNIGFGRDYSVNNYYEAVAKVIGWDGGFVHDLTKPVGMQKKILDITNQRGWGWAPETSLIEGIEMAYKFYLNEFSK